MLGDGWAHIGRTTGNINARIGFKQSIVHLDNFSIVYFKLNHYCSSLPTPTQNYMRGKLFQSIQLQTRAIPCFTKIYYMFYIDGKKRVPEEIEEFLDPIALAQWIEDDGSVHKDGKLMLCTDNFNLFDVHLLVRALTFRYKFCCTIVQRDKTKQQFRIFILKRSMDSLRSIVGKHIANSMKYKVHL